VKPRAAALRPTVALMLVIAAATALGCSFSQQMPEKRRFVLRAQRPAEPESRCRTLLTVGRFRVAPLFEREGFVSLRGEDTFKTSFFDEFKRPPGVMLREVALNWLRDAGLFADVLEPGDAPLADWALQGRVLKLYADVRQADEPAAVLEIDFELSDATTAEAVLTRSYGQAVPARSNQAEAIVAAWQQALATVLTGLEADLREFLKGRGLCEPTGAPPADEASRRS
jgi:ABC-type uncharacterized transport system auxiliary subunit